MGKWADLRGEAFSFWTHYEGLGEKGETKSEKEVFFMVKWVEKCEEIYQ